MRPLTGSGIIFRVKLMLGRGASLGAAAIVIAGCHGETLNAENGRCGPTPHLLVSAAAYPSPEAGGEVVVVDGMTVSGSGLYFTVAGQPLVGGALMTVSTFGGAPAQIATQAAFVGPPLVSATSVIADEAVHDASNNFVGILSIPRAGGAPTTLAMLTNGGFVTYSVMDETSVYFTDGSGVEAVPLAPAATPATPTLLSPEFPVSLGVFGKSLLLLLQSGEVEGIPLGSGDGGAETVLGSGPANPVGESLINCGTSACWLAGGEIEEMDPAGGLASTVAGLSGSVSQPSLLLFDGTSFFVMGTAGSTSAIARIPQQGGAAAVVATLPAISTPALAVDDACVYFATSTGIFSLLKSSTGVVIP